MFNLPVHNVADANGAHLPAQKSLLPTKHHPPDRSHPPQHKKLHPKMANHPTHPTKTMVIVLARFGSNFRFVIFQPATKIADKSTAREGDFFSSLAGFVGLGLGGEIDG